MPVIITMLVILVAWQIVCIYYLQGQTGWDPHTLLQAATNHSGTSRYFSMYPNNLFTMYILHGLWLISGKQDIVIFTKILCLINLFIVDSGIFIIKHVTLKATGKGVVANIATIMYISCFAAFPWFVIPYSDIPALFLCLLGLEFLVNIMQKHPCKLRDCFLAGVCMSISYLIKPSSIILYIAFVIVIAFYKLNKSSWRNLVSKLGIMILIALSLTLITNKMTTSGHLVSVDKSMAFSPWHFVDMGLANDGQYNDADVATDMKIISSSKRKKHDIYIAKKRLKEHGFFGYQQFLYNKQEKNTSDGSLGWGVEGRFLISYKDPKALHNSLPGRLFTTNGVADRFHGGLEVVNQVIWLVLIICLFASLFENNEIMVFLKMGIVGFFLFLLLFEGGRSRYLIQFLPILIITSSCGLYSLIKRTNKLINVE